MICRRSSSSDPLAGVLPRALLLFCWLASSAAAQEKYSLPLHGYFHPGRSMPLRLELQEAAISIRFTGAVPIEVAANADGIVPLLTLDASVRDADGRALNALDSDQRLIAADAGLGALAATVFPDAKILRIDPVSFAGPADAWESLDGLLTDQQLPASLDAAALLAHGMTIAVRRGDRPMQNLPWQRVGPLWIARPIAPPIEALLSSAYLPVESWRQDLSPVERGRLVAVTTLVCLIGLASTLVPGRRGSIVIAGTMSACIVGVLIWRNQQSPVRHVGGSVYVQQQIIQQEDRWMYWRSARARSVHVLERPLPIDADHAQTIGLQESIQPDGSVGWKFHLSEGVTLATLRREMEVPAMQLETTRQDSPLERLAEGSYATSGMTVAAMRPTISREWLDVIVREGER